MYVRENADGERRLQHLLRGLAFLTSAASVLFVLLFLVVAFHRLRYPFDIDRMEDGMLSSVWRLRHGYALYSAPGLDWAPFLYAPLFFYVAAAVTKVVGIGYAALRLVSIAGTLGSFALIFALVHRETRRHGECALFAVGVFAALYPFALAWYDVGRVDSLALFFFLAALLATRSSWPVLAAVLWLLAFLTKQTFLPMGFAVFLIDWQRPRRMLTGMVAYAVFLAATIAWLQHVSAGWFRYYAFGTAGVIHWSWHQAVMFPFADLLRPLPIACGLVLAAAFGTGLRWRERDGTYFAVVSVVVTGAIWFVRAHEGANVNAIIPLYAWMAVLSGVALDRILARFERSVPMAHFVWLLALLQLAAHLYRPAEVPTGNLAARLQFLAALRATPGDVWVLDHSFDALRAGKGLHADMDALDAVLGRGYAPALQEFRERSGGARWSAVVLDRVPASYQPAGLFTTPPFTTVYRLRAVAPGSEAPGDADQPRYTLLPCTPRTAAAGVADVRATYVDRSACAEPDAGQH